MNLHIDSPERAIAHATGVAQSGALEEAVGLFQRALQHFGYRADLLTNLGLTLARLGRSDEAVHALRNALLLDPRLREAHLNLGLSLLGQKRFEEAAAVFQQALTLFPNDSGAKPLRAGCRGRSEQRTKPAQSGQQPDRESTRR